jgi:hypothetical protein
MLESQEYKAVDEKPDEASLSPSEKLEENRPLGSLTPGVEKPDSVEIKKEIRPNTE